jgi:hypothetical protein
MQTDRNCPEPVQKAAGLNKRGAKETSIPDHLVRKSEKYF